MGLAAGTFLLGAAGCGGNNENSSDAAKPDSAASGAVDVTLKEFTLTPSPATAPAGEVTFKVTNSGTQKHEFVVIKTGDPADSLLKGEEADEGGAVDEIGDVPPGETRKLSVNLKTAHYALICNLPGHYKAGQSADFDVSG
jgi:uncharacterized cupredoxin-like copper-binding protein